MMNDTKRCFYGFSPRLRRSDDMSVSIIIPCFNAAATIGEAIASALAQCGPGGEILVVDDGSTDRSLAIARGFGPGVRVVTGPNRGVSAARNRGIAETAGEWLVFLDADDLLLPETLARRLATAAATDADVIVCDWQDLVESSPLRLTDRSARSISKRSPPTRKWPVRRIFGPSAPR